MNDRFRKLLCLGLSILACISFIGIPSIYSRSLNRTTTRPNQIFPFNNSKGQNRLIGPATNRKPGPAIRLYNDKITVLMYHDIEPVSTDNDIITPKQFADELDLMKERGIEFITLQQFRDYMNGGKVPDNAALITFDDGYESFYKYAYPIMKKRNIFGVCFVVTGDFSKDARVYTPHMTEAEIKDMISTDPEVEVQAHTDALHYKIDNKHDALTGYLKQQGHTEKPAQYMQRIVNDLRTCSGKLRSLNANPIDSFAYPYGLHTPIVIRLLKQNGIQFAFTTQPGRITRASRPMLLPRVNAGSPSLTPEILYQSIANVHGQGKEAHSLLEL